MIASTLEAKEETPDAGGSNTALADQPSAQPAASVTQNLQAKLARLKNFHTRYELIADNGAQRVLIGYTSRKGRAGLLAMVRQHPDKFLQYFRCADSPWTWGKRASDGAKINGWTINFSGRTQREAFIDGELPFFCALLRAASPAR